MSNSHSLATNTVLVYIRMAVVMVVSLFTVRVILRNLGDIDYGIYSVIAGAVSMFSFLSGSMSTATLRYFSVALGKEQPKELHKIFSLSVTSFGVINIVLFIVIQIGGLIFINYYMVMPVERLMSANLLFQCIVLSFISTVFAIPYITLIIAHENMKVFAYISILEAVLKITIAFLISISPFEKLAFYGLLLLISSLITTLTYKFYCNITYFESRYQYYWNKPLFTEMFAFTGWNMVGSIANIGKSQGMNILLNIFCGPLLNAAMAIALQVNGAMNAFVTNFYTVVRPRITKYYVSNDTQLMYRLVFSSTKFSAILVLLLALPLLLKAEYILNVWLSSPPPYTVLFVQLFVVNIFLECVNNQIYAVFQASGKIKRYQLTVCLFLLLNIPLSFVLLKYEFEPYYILISMVLITFLSYVPQYIIAYRILNFPIMSFLKEVVLKLLVVAGLSCFIVIMLEQLCFSKTEELCSLILTVILSAIITISLSFFLVLNNYERQGIKKYISKI